MLGPSVFFGKGNPDQALRHAWQSFIHAHRRHRSGLAIHLAPVAHLDDLHHYFRFLDAVNDAVAALPDAIAFLGGKLLGTGWARVIAQGLDTGEDARHIGLRDAPQVFGD